MNIHAALICLWEVNKMAKISATKAAYRKERKRVLQFISRAKKRGYVFEESVVPDLVKTPRAKDVKALKQLTPTALYKKSYKIDTYTGEAVEGIEGRKQERKTAAQKARQTRKRRQSPVEYYPDEADIIINNVSEEIESLDFGPLNRLSDEIDSQIDSASNMFGAQRRVHAENANRLKALLNAAIRNEGMENVARRIKENYDELYETSLIVSYGSDQEQVNIAINRFTTLITGHALTMEDARYNSDYIDSTMGW